MFSNPKNFLQPIELKRILYRERSILGRDDLIRLEDVVTRVLGRGTMEIEGWRYTACAQFLSRYTYHKEKGGR